MLAACLPYITPSLPVSSHSDSLYYEVIPMRSDTMTQWKHEPPAMPTPLMSAALAPDQVPYDYVLGAGDMISLIIYTFDAKGEQSAIRVFPEGLPITGED